MQKSLKELMEQTQNQSNIVNLKKNKLKTFNKKKMRLTGIFFQQKIRLII